MVGRYNKLLKELGQASGLDFSRFLVPDDELKPEVVAFRRPGYSGRGGSVTYSKTRYCEKQAMAQRLTAVTTFIASFQPLPARPTMGFQPPDYEGRVKAKTKNTPPESVPRRLGD